MVSTASWLATSPAAAPPMPSQTTNNPWSARTRIRVLVDRAHLADAGRRANLKPHWRYSLRMNWLVKEEPENYSYSQFAADQDHGVGRRQESGRAAQPAGDEKGRPRVLLPHRQRKGGYRHGHRRQRPPIRIRRDDNLVVVELAAGKALKRPVTLAEIKADKRFATMPLVRIARLSVQPVTDEQWEMIEGMSKH